MGQRYQRTGRAGAHTEPCKVGFSDRHNTREVQVHENPNTSIRPELIKNNTVWLAPDVPSLWRLDQEIRKDYAKTERTVKMKDGTTHTCHRELPSKGKTAASPLKETVLNLPTNGPETDAMVEAFALKVEELTGWRCVRRFVHRDERYDDPDTGEQHFNGHAHLVWDCYNHQTHEIIKVGKATMRQIQDIAAEVTGMERGIDARVTGADGISVAAFKSDQERKRAEDLKSQNLALQQEVADLRTQLTSDLQSNCTTLAKVGRNMVVQFDRLARSEAPTEKEKESRDLLAEECQRQVEDIDKQLREHEYKLHTYLDRTAAAVHALTARIIKKAAAAKRALAAAARKNRALKFFVPSADLKEVASIDEMQARINKADADRDTALTAQANAERAKEAALTQKRNAVADKEKAERALATAQEDGARPWKAKCDALQEKVDGIPAQVEEARKNGRKSAIAEWDKAYYEKYKPTAEERDKLKEQVTQLQADLNQSYADHTAQAVNTAKMLMRQWGPGAFEKAGLEFTTYNSWQTAKKELQKEQQQHTSTGKGMGH